MYVTHLLAIISSIVLNSNVIAMDEKENYPARRQITMSHIKQENDSTSTSSKEEIEKKVPVKKGKELLKEYLASCYSKKGNSKDFRITFDEIDQRILNQGSLAASFSWINNNTSRSLDSTLKFESFKENMEALRYIYIYPIFREAT